MTIKFSAIILACKDYCHKYAMDFAEVIRDNGGENELVRKVIELDQMATFVENVSSGGAFYECMALGRCTAEPNYGLVKWAFDKGYSSYNSAEVICRGGYVKERRKSLDTSRYDIDGDVIEEVEYVNDLIPNKVVKKHRITVGVYEYTYASGDVIRTCGVSPRVCFDALHPNHEHPWAGENCWFNGEFMSLAKAMEIVKKI